MQIAEYSGEHPSLPGRDMVFDLLCIGTVVATVALDSFSGRVLTGQENG